MSITPLPRPYNQGARERSPAEPQVSSGAQEADDAFLARSVSQSGTAALEQLISRYWSPLTSYASRILGDMALAEDVVQKMFVSIWSGRHGWSPRSVRAYLFRSTRNLALDELRSRQARHRREEESARSDVVRQPRRPDAVLEEVTISEAVDAAIQKLPERRREAFVLAYLRNLSYNEVAAVMGVSPKTVGHHISAALAELRQSLMPVVTEHRPNASDPSIRPLHRDAPTASPSPGPS